MSTERPLSQAQEEQVKARADADADFRARLHDDPKGAIREELGLELADDQVTELSDDDLEQAAGGSGLFGPPEKLPPA